VTAAGRVAVIVAAAGRGERLGPGAPKALRELGGVPLLVHAVRAMAGAASVDVVVVVVPADEVGPVRILLDAEATSRAELLVVAGGDSRRSSVRCGLAALPVDVDVVLVHDAARPLAPGALADAVAQAVRAGADAVVPGLPLADTVKAVDGAEFVTSTPDRATLRAVQTPQGFARSVLQAAHDAATDDAATDDAGLVERNGGRVLVVAGSGEAFKVTRPIDLVLAEAVLARRRADAHG
jgi:2-C-methyl-D-erythritol 4-phosphate cytidylyltransferase